MKKRLTNKKRKIIYITSLVLSIGTLLLVGCERKDNVTEDATGNTSGNPAVTSEAEDNNSEAEANVTPTPVVTESPDHTGDPSPTVTPASQSSDSITYSNTDYGFDFTLPAGWEGYTLQIEDWQGTALEGEDQGKVVEAGTKIMIRHPKWTEENPRQDIPIMVFTLEQWDKVAKEEIAVSAAPIGPTELGRNSKYVFALPARYNYAFPTGYEEVDKIIQDGALKATENYK